LISFFSQKLTEIPKIFLEIPKFFDEVFVKKRRKIGEITEIS